MVHSVQPGDPHDGRAHVGDPLYAEESDTRRELARVMGICDGCRRCTDLCGVFPSLIERLDALPGRDAGLMTPALQDEVMDRCLHCGMCAVGCPYGSTGAEDLGVDLPRLAVRVQAVRRSGGHLPLRRRWADRVLGATDRQGAVAVRFSGAVNRVLGAPGGSVARRALRAVSGVSATRLLPPVARERFTTIARRTGRMTGDAAVVVLPTCAVEYHEPEIGRDLLAVLAHNAVEAGVSRAVCCGAPWLHSGDLPRFEAQARRVLAELGPAVARGAAILVPQPSCAQVIRREYPHYLGAAEAADLDPAACDVAALAAAVRDPLEFLDAHGMVREFPGQVPAQIVYHAACPQRVTGVDVAEMRVLESLDVPVRRVARCSGTDGFWGLRAGNEEAAMTMAEQLAAELSIGRGAPGDGTGDCAPMDPATPDGAAPHEVMCGGCHLANTAITELSGRPCHHPISLLARAYGL